MKINDALNHKLLIVGGLNQVVDVKCVEGCPWPPALNLAGLDARGLEEIQRQHDHFVPLLQGLVNGNTYLYDELNHWTLTDILSKIVQEFDIAPKGSTAKDY